jgi:hypothetical protein
LRSTKSRQDFGGEYRKDFSIYQVTLKFISLIIEKLSEQRREMNHNIEGEKIKEDEINY